MEKIRLGRTGMMVTKLGFGGIPIQRDSEEEAIAVVKRCLELGITYIDTANAYTTSEERIGKAIKGQRKKLILATKTQSRTRETVENHLKLSLKRLEVEYIDLYQFHNVSDSAGLNAILAPNGPMALVEEAKKAGLVKHIGVTSHSLDMAKELVKTDRFETIMFPFNFIEPEAAEQLLPLAREHDVGFIAMKPLAGGILDNVSIAFKYLCQFPDVVTICGIQKVNEIEEIIPVLEGSPKLTAKEKRDMEQLRQTLGKRFCHRCDYCQPCEQGIPISIVMQLPAYIKRIPPESYFSGFVLDAMDKAVNCIQCGDCEERCPYHLPIRDIIEEHVKLYESQKKYQAKVAK